MPDDAPTLTGWQVVALYTVTLVCSSACILVPFALISRTKQLLDAFTGSSPIYLRGVTVILVIWAATLLSVQGKLTEGPAAIMGMIAGYVFGAQNRPGTIPSTSDPVATITRGPLSPQ